MRCSPLHVALLVALTGVLVSAPARAGQSSFEADLFHPTDTGSGYFSVDGAFPVRHLGFTAGLFGTWAHDPLVLRDTSGNVPAGGEVIGNQLAFDLVGSFGLIDRLELGVDLPFVPYQATDNSLIGLPGGIASGGVGDLRVDLKMLVYVAQLDPANRIGLTLIAGLRLPTGDTSGFLGQDGITGAPRAVAEWQGRRASVAASFGAVLRSTRTLDDLAVTHQLAYGIAGRVTLYQGLSALGEVSGLVGVGLPDGAGGLTASEAPLELALGARYHWRSGIEASLGGGAGLTRGYGAPDGRILFGVRYQSPPHAPAPLPAASAPTPPRPATPKKPVAVMVKPVAPPPAPKVHDTDGDGIPDAEDRCPAAFGVAANGGCPDVDSDGDGLVDRLDKCPLAPETYNGNQDDDGCPDAGRELARITDTKVEIEEPIVFGPNNQLGPRARKIIGVVARLLVVHPEITTVRVEGHTDDRGSALDNLDRSRDQAAAVRRLLVQDGVDGDRLSAVGYGPDRPIADNRTAAGRAKNRRIEFTILERKPVAPSPPAAPSPSVR